MPIPTTSPDLAAELARYDWYHSIDVAPGIRTQGLKLHEPLQPPIMDELRRHDLAGKRFLDIGCRDGLFSFEAEKMGASEILGPVVRRCGSSHSGFAFEGPHGGRKSLRLRYQHPL
jgi:hypothetical protein